MLRVWGWLRPSTSGVWKKEYPMRPVWSRCSTLSNQFNLYGNCYKLHRDVCLYLPKLLADRQLEIGSRIIGVDAPHLHLHMPDACDTGQVITNNC